MNSFKAFMRRAQTPAPGSASTQASDFEKSQSEEEKSQSEEEKSQLEEGNSHLEEEPSETESQEQQHTIVTEEENNEVHDEQASTTEADHADLLQPTIVEELNKEGHEEQIKQAFQPSIAPKDLIQGMVILNTANNDNQAQQDSFQPSIDPGYLPSATPDSNTQVLDWLDNTDASQQLDPEQVEDSPTPEDNGGAFMTAEDQARLAQYIEDDNRDTPDREDEEATDFLPAPIDLRLERVRNMDKRPSKRKRGNSSAGRRSKSRSMSRDPESQGHKVQDSEAKPKRLSMELPRRDEFNPLQTQRLPPENYLWGFREPSPPLDETNLKNLGVRDVNPLDDDEEGYNSYRGTLGARTVVPFLVPDPPSPEEPPAQPRQRPPARPRGALRTRPAQRSPTPMEVDDEVESEAEPEQPVGIFGAPPKTINDLPREVYRKIFRELLLSDVQIYVYERWTKVYPSSRHRNKFNIDPAILRVCKRAYWDGIHVLYGENVFVYSLRDAHGPIAKPPADVEQIAQDDSSTQIEEDDVSEYQDDDADTYAEDEEQVTSRRRRRATKDWLGDIHIAKYFSLFRRIIIEAEHNRYGVETKQSMADAINFWNDPPGLESQPLIPISPISPIQAPNNCVKKNKRTSITKKVERKPEKPKSSNIHTLALRIFPSNKISNEGVPYVTFISFISFFAADSPVVEALQTIKPQFTRLEIIWKYFNPACRPTCLSVDMRHLYIRRNVAGGDKDVWGKDRLMQKAREDGVSRAMSALGRLQERLEAHCEKNQPKEQPADEGMELDFAWEDEEWLAQDADGEFVEG